MTKSSKLTVDLVEGLTADIRDLPMNVQCTWKQVEDLVRRRGSTVTRQWASKHPGIVAAYEAARLARRQAKANNDERPAPEDERVAQLKDKVRTLEGIIAGYDKVFLRHIHNATQHGITLSELEAPLPVIDGQASCP